MSFESQEIPTRKNRLSALLPRSPWWRGAIAFLCAVAIILPFIWKQRMPPDLARSRSETREEVVLDFIRMEACRAAWNSSVQDFIPPESNQVSAARIEDIREEITVGDEHGEKVSLKSIGLTGVDICGVYFIPYGKGNTAKSRAYVAQRDAIENTMSNFQYVARRMFKIIDDEKVLKRPAPQASESIKGDSEVLEAVAVYNQSIKKAMTSNSLSSAEMDESIPITIPPKRSVSEADIQHEKSKRGTTDWLSDFNKGFDDTGWQLRRKVSNRMAAFDVYERPAEN